jgi:two-component system sensor histidine kinase YesM
MAFISITVNLLFLNILTENEIEYNVQTSNDTKKQFELLLKLVDNTATLLCSNKDLLNQLEYEPNVLEQTDVPTQHGINSLLKNAISVQEYIRGIYIIGMNGQYYTSDWSVGNDIIQHNYHFLLSNDEYTSLEKSMNYYLYSEEGTVLYVRPIIRYPSDPALGAIIIDLDTNYLGELFTISSIQGNEKVLVLNENGETLFSFPYITNMEEIIQDNPEILKSDALSYKTSVFGEQSIIVSNTVDYSDWKIVRIISTESINRNTNNMATIVMGASAVIIIISFIVSFTLSLKITRPILKLNDKMMLVQKGDLSVENLKLEVKSTDELGQLSQTFNYMVTKINHLIDQSLKEQKKKSDMEFQILQAQINPHFLYNTLGSIQWLANIQKADNISKMTSALINLLKYNISCKATMVPLMDELDSVNNYIEIQKYRCSDFFSVEYCINEDTTDCMILRFTLQPIVENAIYHGFDCFRESSVIKITSHLSDDNLIVSISDNGKGSDSTSLQSLVTKENKKFSGVGLPNIENRIKLYFGQNYGLSFYSEKGVGTTVTLTLPNINGSKS